MAAGEIQSALIHRLEQGLGAIGVTASQEQLSTLVAFVEELNRWNNAYNLTAVRDREEMIDRHIVDSLAIAQWIRGQRILDVGSGGGLPGVPLAIMMPERQFVLIDSNGKKVRFLRHVRRTLGLDNVEAQQARVEEYSAPAFDQITARAFAAPAKMAALVDHLLAPDGELLCMTGVQDGGAIDGYKLRQSCALSVPGGDKQRHILVYSRWHESSR